MCYTNCMGKVKRIFIRAVCLLLTLFLAFAFAACFNQDFPPEDIVIPPDGGGSQEPDEDVPPQPQPPADVELTEFFARAYNAMAQNFTISISAQTSADGINSDAKEVFSLIYDCTGQEAEYELADENGKSIYKDGLLFAQTEQEDVYTAVVGESALPRFELIEQRKLQALLEMLSLSGTVSGQADGYIYNAKSDLTLHGNAVLNIFKQNIHESAIVCAAGLINYFADASYTTEQAEELILFYGDAPLIQILQRGEIISPDEFRILYNTVRGLLQGSYEMPAYSEFMNKYSSKSLSELLHAGSAAGLIDYLKDNTLYALLSAYEYTDATLADFFAASDVETSFELLELSIDFKADKNFVLSEFNFSILSSMKDVPVFETSLTEGGLKREIINVKNGFALTGSFSDVGNSKAEMPLKYALVGEQIILISGGGNYPLLCGSENVRINEDDGLKLEIESSPVEDPAAWAEVVKKIGAGMKIDYEDRKLTVTDEAYENIVKAFEMGMTRLTVRAFENVDFIICVQ